MFDIGIGNAARRCDGMSRRNFVRVGGLGVLGLGMSSLLRAEAHAADDPEAPKARAKSIILVYLGGGLSHHDTFDPKPDAQEEIRGKYQTISANVTGLRVGELLPRMAQSMDKVALVRSGAHNNDHHETATNWVLSGRFGSAFGDWPSMGAVAAHELGFAGTLPPYVAVPRNPSFTWELGKSAFLGGRYESFKAGDPNDGNYRVRDLAPATQMPSARVDRRRNLLAAVDQLAKKIENSDQIMAYDEFQGRAAAMVLSGEARDAFAIDKESGELRDQYGRHTFGQSCLLARRLVERGVRFVTVNFGGWDHHAKIWEGLERMLPQFDQGFSSLVTDMHERGLMDDTLVVCMGEFGRTPKVNKDVGRDHWAPAASMLFAGAGVKVGQVIGATDRDGAYVTKDPVSPTDVSYTMLSALGINPRKQISTPDGRPVEILDQGGVIEQLYS